MACLSNLILSPAYHHAFWYCWTQFPQKHGEISHSFLRARDSRLTAPSPKATLSPLKSCSLSQVSADGKLESGRCHKRCAGGSWHGFLSCLLVLHKGAVAIATTQTVLYKGFQEDTGLGPGPSRPTPAPGRRAARETAQQSVPIFTLAPPPWPQALPPWPQSQDQGSRYNRFLAVQTQRAGQMEEFKVPPAGPQGLG